MRGGENGRHSTAKCLHFSAGYELWTIGGGSEYAIDDNWSLKAEYLFVRFGKETFVLDGARAGVTKTSRSTTGTSDMVTGRKASNDLDLHTIKLGVNYRF